MLGCVPLSLAGSTPASAANNTGSVKIYTVKSPVAKANKKVAIKSGNRVIAKNKKSVSLARGAYTVITNVSYVKSNVKPKKVKVLKASSSQRLVVRSAVPAKLATSSLVNASYVGNVPSSLQSQWRADLPKVCSNVTIRSFSQVNKDSSKWSIHASAKKDLSLNKYYFTINVSDDLLPSSAPARALMKHECGHIYLMEYFGRLKNSQDEMLKIRNRNKISHEYMSDCIADVLGAVRTNGSYKVGYGTVCSPAAIAYAKKVVNAVNK